MARPSNSHLRDYLGHLAVERGLSPNSIAAYRRDLERYLSYLSAQGKGAIADIAADDVAGFLEAARSGSDGGTPLAASSAARLMASVRGWHRFLEQEGTTTANPTSQVPTPKLPLRLPHALAVDQVQLLLETAGTGDPPESLRNRALLELLYATGARVSEITALDTDTITWGPDSELALIAVVGKGNKERLVPVGGYARGAVDDYLVRARPALLAKGSGTHALFLNTRGRRLSRQSVWEIIQTTAARANLTEHVTPHTLRHSFATHLLQGGADVRVVQELLGHASVTTTQIYTMVTRDQLREVYLTSHPRAL
ncbi:MAG: site-specific tyrosine recombinase XerD [Promicromonosporaceae bacterium]|nr:site-specific tyrosine recombinase XerD [Promicromonosporaceae bacterium]